MTDSVLKGYDAAHLAQYEDDLDRWRFAREIADVVLATPTEWSTRIGIFGKWGEGKTTVLHFIEKILTQNEAVVFSFNPWAIQNWDDLWQEFGNRLLGALSTAKVPVDSSWRQWLRDSRKWLQAKRLDRIAEATASVLGREKAYNSAFGVVSSWLRYDGPQISAIQKTLGRRRIVVVIDDLDRCAPNLVPKLLLSLRELLDLPGFAFLLAFDDDIVAGTLEHENPAWNQGSDFLEKILDFRFHLPRITDTQKKRLMTRAVSSYCPFVPLPSVAAVMDLLPNNPRKLKSLIRSMVTLKPQLERHDSDELNWVDMWLAQMLHMESHAFFERLLEGDALEREVGTLYKLLKDDRRNRFDKEQKPPDESIRNMLNGLKIADQSKTQRILELIAAIRSRATSKFQYACKLAIQPEAITWKEFRSFYADWSAHNDSQMVSEWIRRHAADRAVSIEDVEQEFFGAVIAQRGDLLAQAAASASTAEHDAYLKDAAKLLTLAQRFLVDLEKLDAKRFKKLFGQILYWIGFRKNPADADMRAEEQVSIMKVLNACSGTVSIDLLEVITQHDYGMDFGDGTLPLKKELRDMCMSVVGPKGGAQAIEFLKSEDKLRSLSERGRFVGVKYCLFHSDSPVWKPDLRKVLLEVIRSGREDAIVYENVRNYFDLLVHGLEHGIDLIGREEIAHVLHDPEFSGLIWNVATSRSIQYRMRMAFLQARRLLIQNNVSEELLPLTAELQSRLDDEKSKASV